MKSIIKNTVIGVVALATTLTVSAQSAISFTLIPGGVTNLNYAVPSVWAPATLKTVTIQATTATNASVRFVDAPTNQLTYVLGAYTTHSKYATNLVTAYTNFFGVVNQFTNVQLITVTNSVAQSTNSYNIIFSGSAIASTTTEFDNVNYSFSRGVLVTNTSSGTAAITVSYEK